MELINPANLTRSSMEVKVIRTISPAFFWVHLKYAAQDLTEMLKELQLRMYHRHRGLKCFPDDVSEDAPVAVIDEDGKWQRGIVLRYNPRTGMVKIFLVDGGIKIWKRIQETYRLEKQFCELPGQAIACGLPYIEPCKNTMIWPQRTRDLCHLLATGRDGSIKIVSAGSGVAWVELTIDQGAGRSFNLRKTLIDLGHLRASRWIAKDVFPAI